MIKPNVILLLLSALNFRASYAMPINLLPQDMPQCSNPIVVQAEMNFQQDKYARLLAENGTAGKTFLYTNKTNETIAAAKQEDQHYSNVTFYVQDLTMLLNQTYCMFVKMNSSSLGIEPLRGRSFPTVMHIIEYVALEHHYPVSNIYQFGIPEITQNCRCDCAGGQQKACRIEDYKYKNCSSQRSSLCYRIYRSDQSNAGCLTSGKAELCCEILLKPHNDWVFQAIRLRQPTTFAVLRYRILERTFSGGRRNGWGEVVNKAVHIPLNKGATNFELNEMNRLQIIAIGGRTHRQVEPGLYFFRRHGDVLDSGAGDRLSYNAGVPLNEQMESDMGKLGWFRWDRTNGWYVRKGLEKITETQHVDVSDCMAQRYSSTITAEQLVLRGNGKNGDELDNFNLGTLVRDDPWVHEVEVQERFVRVVHSEGVALTLNVRTDSKPQVYFQTSHFSNFTGSLMLDKFSNRYLNLTFYNARGTLIGQVFSSADSLSAMEVVFSVEVSANTQPKYTSIVAMPKSINSPKLVCIYCSGDLESKICHRLDYVWEQSDQPVVTSYWQWQDGKGECNGCNERGVDGLLISLDPRNWFDGLNTPTEIFTCILEVVLCVAILLLSVIVTTKCIFPLFRCVFKIAKPWKKKASR